MSKWLQRIWVSPREHQEIVEELQHKIERLEQDFVEVAQSLISKTEARRQAERVRNELLRSSGNVVLLSSRRP